MRVLLLSAYLSFACAEGGDSAPVQLRVEGRECPVLGVESRLPFFQWAAPTNQTQQVSVCIHVKAYPSAVVIWDSGIQNTTKLSLTYDGPRLAATTTYSFAVQTWDVNATAPSAFSEEGFFVTGVWGNWSAQPVWHSNLSASFTFIRAEVPLPQSQATIANAIAFVTANPQPSIRGEVENTKLLAAYRFYVNSAWIGVGPGRPGNCGPVCPIQNDELPCTCAPHHWYDSYNVTSQVRL
jgi:hypothetical protein